MASTITIKRSAVPGKAPGVADLALGELAINTHDGTLYLKRDQGGDASVVELRAPHILTAGEAGDPEDETPGVINGQVLALAVAALGGKVLQVVHVQDDVEVFKNGWEWQDFGGTISITPTRASSKILYLCLRHILLIGDAYFGGFRTGQYGLRLRRGSTTVTEQTVGNIGDSNFYYHGIRAQVSSSWMPQIERSDALPFIAVDAPNTTDEVTYQLQLSVSGGGVVTNLTGYQVNGAGQVNARSELLAVEIAG